MKRKRTVGASTPNKYPRLGYKGTPYKAPEYKSPSYAMYKSPRHVFPQEYVTQLTYSVIQQVGTAGLLNSSLNYTSDAYDVDPAFASTAMPGFAEAAAIWARFRTLAMSYQVEFVNLEAFSVGVYAGFATQSAGTSGAVVEGNPNYKSRFLGPAGGQPRAMLKGSKSILAITGTKQALYDDLFTGSTGSSTLSSAGKCFVDIGINTSGPLFVNGASVKVNICLKVQFYRPFLLQT